MSRSRFKIRRRRRLSFTDRTAVLAEIMGLLGITRGERDRLHVIGLIGLGGAGKSRLLDEIVQRARAIANDIDVVKVTLESEGAGTILAPMKAIRDRMSFQCLLFDCAIVSYWSAAGLPFRISEGSGLSKSKILGAIEASAGVAGIGLPLSFAAEMFDKARREVTRKRLYKKAEFEAIDDLRDSPNQLLERLPHYLGLDIDRHLQLRNRRIVLLYDSYEKQTAQTLKQKAEWLREFIGTMDRGVHVIASREALRWPEADWRDVVTELVVDALPESDCRTLLRAETQADAKLIDHMIHVSRGIPFFLEACIESFLSAKENDEDVGVADLPASQTEAVARLMDHLGPTERELVLSLAAVQFFDALLFRSLVRDLNLPLPYSAFEDITSLFFVESADRLAGLYKVHDVLTEFVRQTGSLAASRVSAVRTASRSLWLRANSDDSPELLLPMFAGLLQAMALDDKIDIDVIEAAIDVGYSLYDRGFWRELIAAGSNNAFRHDSDGELIARFFYALSLRRTESIGSAQVMLGSIREQRNRFGKHADAIDMEIAYLKELSGEYRDARIAFADLSTRCTPFDPSNRTHVRSALYRADMMILDGKMEEGADLLLESSAALEATNRLDWAEFVRHRAHAFRYSLLFDDAETLYLSALGAVSNVPSLAAKLIGNLAECQCWTDPKRAIATAEAALEANGRLRNQVELAKNHAVLCTALALTDSHAATEVHYRAALQHADAVGYLAGVLFAEIAGCVAASLSGQAVLFQRRFENARVYVSRLGTYEHLLLAPTLLDERSDHVETIVGHTGWIEAAGIAARVDLLARRLRGPLPTA